MFRIRLAFAAFCFALVAACRGNPAGNKPVDSAAATPGVLTVDLTEGTNMSLAASPDGRTLLLAIQGTLFSLPAGGGDAKALTPPEMDAHEPAFSPDGKTIAFYSFADDGFSVWTMNVDGSGLIRRSAAAGDARYPTFSPDGGALLFASDAAGGYSVYSLPLAGGEPGMLVDARSTGYAPTLAPYFSKSGNAVLPALSPDGGLLAYVVDGRTDALMVRPTDGKAPPRKLFEDSVIGGPAFTPNGEIVAISLTSGESQGEPARQARLVQIDPATGGVKTLVGAGDIFPFRPSVTQSGDIYYAADGGVRKLPAAGGAPETTTFRASVTLDRTPYARKRYDLDDRAPQRALGILDPSLSPDGRRLVFAALGDLWLADLPSGEPAQRLTDDAWVDVAPSWSPDGARIAFVSDRGGSTQLWSMEVATGKLAELTKLAAPPVAPVWSPAGDRIAFLATSRASIFLAGKVAVLDIGTGAVEMVSDELFGPSAPAWSPSGKRLAVMARQPASTRFREGVNALLLLDPGRVASPEWVHARDGASLGRRQWNRPAWRRDGLMTVQLDNGLWTFQLADSGQITGETTQLVAAGENPSWSADGSAMVFVDGDRLRIWSAGVAKDLDVAPTWSRHLSDQSFTLRAGRMFDGRNATLQTDVDIVVEAGLITAIRPAGSAAVVGALVDMSGMTVLPGLIESHTHQSTTLGVALGELWLKHGVTSVRETGVDPFEAVERREAEASGRRPGPRVFTAGPLNEGGRVSYGVSETVGTAADALEAARLSSALQLDMLKSYVRQDYKVQKVIVAAAHAAGIPVSGHELYPAVANGVDAIEHVGGTSRRGFSTKITAFNRSYQDVTALIARSGMVLTPTLALSSGNGTRDIAPVLETVRRIHADGGVIVAGTDSPFVPYADSTHTEIEMLVRAGFTTAEALTAATFAAAKAIGADSEIGSIEVGKLADIIAVEGDPLTNIRDTRRVVWTMKSGDIVFDVGER